MAIRIAPLTRGALAESLASCGLAPGDTVLVHSDLFAIGPVQGNQEDILPMYYDAFWDVLGKEGTLVVPAYFYDYGRWGTPYDSQRSPVSRELGVFAQYVTNQAGALRSLNPIAALAAVGVGAQYISRGGTGSAFGSDSPWDRLFQSNGKMIFIGVDLRAMTFVHFVEHRVGVPHLYNKFYTVPVSEDGCIVNLPICAQVPYLDFDVVYDLDSLTSRFERAGLLQTATVGRGTIRCVSAKVAFEFLKERLKQDYFYLLKRAPKFVAGKIPTDVAAGSPRP